MGLLTPQVLFPRADGSVANLADFTDEPVNSNSSGGMLLCKLSALIVHVPFGVAGHVVYENVCSHDT